MNSMRHTGIKHTHSAKRHQEICSPTESLCISHSGPSLRTAILIKFSAEQNWFAISRPAIHMLKLQLHERERWMDACCQLGLNHDSASFSCYQNRVKPIGCIALYFHLKPLTQSAKSPYRSESLHKYYSELSIATHYKPARWKDDLDSWLFSS